MKLLPHYEVTLFTFGLIVGTIMCVAVASLSNYLTNRACARAYGVQQCVRVWTPVLMPEVIKQHNFDQG